MSCAAAVTQVASAADLPTKAPITSPSPLAYNWTGFYIGINAGGHWGRDKINATADQLAFFGGQLESLSSATFVIQWLHRGHPSRLQLADKQCCLRDRRRW